MPSSSSRWPGAVALGVALTLGAGIGAAVQGQRVVMHRVTVAAPRPKPTPTANSAFDLAQQRVQHNADNDGFAFLDPPGPNGEVDRWDPCVPIHYVVDISVGPASATADIAWAFAQLSKATGLPLCLLLNFGKPRVEVKRYRAHP